MNHDIFKDSVGEMIPVPAHALLGAERGQEEEGAFDETDAIADGDASDSAHARGAWYRRAEAEGMFDAYPDFDLDAALSHPVLGAILRGETTPSLRQLFEMTHLDEIVESRVRARTDAEVAAALATAIPKAVSSAVETAVAESEERLLSHIRARGQRPVENGMSASIGIHMHPAVDRLTRRERAMLAERAGRGETVHL